jgi:hypothetical protein
MRSFPDSTPDVIKLEVLCSVCCNEYHLFQASAMLEVVNAEIAACLLHDGSPVVRSNCCELIVRSKVEAANAYRVVGAPILAVCCTA